MKAEMNALGYDEQEFIRNGEKFRIYNVDTMDKMYEKLHEHDFIEIFMLLSGEVTYIMEKGIYKLRDFDIIVVPPHILHKLSVERKDITYKRVVLWINTAYLRSLSTEKTDLGFAVKECLTDNRYVIRNPEYSFMLKPYLEKIIQLSNEKPYGYDLIIENNIREFFITMNKIKMEISNNLVNTATHPIVEKTVFYIESNLANDLSLPTIAKALNFDPFYISHIFSENIGLTIHQYIIKKRLNKAKELLENNLPVKEVIRNVGFRDESHFIQVFRKEFGCTPKKYKMQIAK